MKKFYNLLTLFIFSIAFSQINVNSSILETNWGGDSEPDHLTIVGNKLFFSANIALFYDGNGRELWVKDTPSSKSRIVRDLNSNGSAIEANSDFINFNGMLLFTARTSNGSYKQLWKSDGTSEGTTFVKTVNPNYDTKINNPVIFENKLYFSTYINNSSELWVTDGTEIGTYQVRKINNSGDSNVNNIFIFQNKIYFTANDGIHGNELWSTDGTESGTILVKDFFSGNNGGVFNKPIVYNGELIIAVRQSTNVFGVYNWNANTDQLTLLQNLPISYNPYFDAIENSGYVYFVSRGNYYGNLWKTNGTLIGTQKISTGSLENYVNLEPLTKFKDKIYFKATSTNFESKNWYLEANNDNPIEVASTIPILQNATLLRTSSAGNYLVFDKGEKKYISDGTELGTKEIRNIQLITNYTGYNYNIVDYNDNLIMNAKTQENGVELYSYNFTQDKSELVEDLHHLNSSNYITSATLNGKLIYFGSNNNSGTEIFESDGTKEGTKIVKDLNPSAWSGIVYSGDNPKFFKHNNKLYFRCTNGSSGYEPCITDGTEEGTKILKDISPFNQSVNADPYFMKLNDEIVLFGADDGSNNTASASNLWRTDGTEEGTYQLSLINVVSPNFAKINNKIYYSTYNNVVNNTFTYSIAETDGTSAGTKLFKTLYNDGNVDTMPYIMGSVNNRMIYLYRSNNWWGTNAITKIMSSDGINQDNDVLLANIYNDPMGTPILGTFNNKLFFYVKLTGQNSYRLYSTDGTVEGTQLFTTLLDDTLHNPISPKFISCGSDFYLWLGNKIFAAKNGENLSLVLDSPESNFREPKCLNNNIFFADWKYQDAKIWTSNGTSEGTKFLNLFVDDIFAGNSSYIADVAVTDNQLFFIAWFSDIPELRNSGNELYIADISNLNLSTNEINLYNVNNKNKIFKVVPNPFDDYIQIFNPNNVKINSVSLMDVNGRTLNEWTGENFSEKLEIRKLINGVYILKIESFDGNNEIHKLIKR